MATADEAAILARVSPRDLSTDRGARASLCGKARESGLHMPYLAWESIVNPALRQIRHLILSATFKLRRRLCTEKTENPLL
jgi:hypothetical protein